MKSINQELLELYKINYEKIISIFNFKKELDGPNLIHCYEQDYLKSNRKIMFIGQEGTGNVFRDYLGQDPKELKEIPSEFLNSCIGCYDMIIRNQINKPGGAYWRELLRINNEINGSFDIKNNSIPFICTNVSKYCYSLPSKKKPPLHWLDHKYVIDNLNILPKEIEICKPDVIIFFSGPNYDDKLKYQFNSELIFKELDDQIDKRYLSKIYHPLLPEKTYRTLHPGARIKGKRQIFDLILNDILNN